MVSVCAPGEDCRYGKSGGPVGHERDEPCYIYRAEPPETRAGESASVSHGPKRREQTAEQDGKSGQSFHWRDQAINRNDAKSVEWTENRCFRWRAALALGLTLLCRPASRRAQCFAGHRYQSDQVNDFVRVERKCEREKADLKCETDCRRKDPFQTDRDLASLAQGQRPRRTSLMGSEYSPRRSYTVESATPEYCALERTKVGDAGFGGGRRR